MAQHDAIPAGPGAEERPLRKDAQRSRQRVLEAAGQLFAERGIEVGFDEIARKAGVGVGTVYRRFPDRESLIEALFAARMSQVLRVAAEAAELKDPWESVVAFCERISIEQHRDRGLAQVLAYGAHGLARLEELRGGMERVVTCLLGRAQAAGVVRPDLEPTDLAVITHLISRVNVGDSDEVWRRYLSLFLDAIRMPASRGVLAAPAPTIEMYEEIAHRL